MGQRWADPELAARASATRDPFVSCAFVLRLGLLACTAAASALALAFGMPDSAQARRAAEGAPVVIDQCSWDRPGADSYTGDTLAAVDHYRDIAPEVRHRLKSRMARREYDDVVSIARAAITGRGEYASAIRDMHFGADRICHVVSRSGWGSTSKEVGLVYCEDGQCILVPTVCHNVSRISRIAVPAAPLVVVPPAASVKAPAKLAPDPGPSSFAALSDPAARDGEPAPAASAGPAPGYSPGVIVIVGGPSGPLVPSAPPVPEPETWALTFTGLVVMAVVGLRRLRTLDPNRRSC